MELREWSERILSATSLEEKLFQPDSLTDENPGTAIFWPHPSRPSGMELRKRSKEEKLPGFHELHIPEKRAVCLHRFAGHELLAVEIMAYALLAFPDAPKTFRKGVANTLKEEQGHVRLYIQHMERFGLKFGDLPLYRHFWAHTAYIKTPLHYISMMHLTFEMANLDFAPMYRDHFLRHGDELSAGLMERIVQDEISHVSFGHRWLDRMRSDGKSTLQTWQDNLGPVLTPRRARGRIFIDTYREKAKIPQEWIDFLKNIY